MIRLVGVVLLTALAAGTTPTPQVPAPATVYYADTVVIDVNAWTPEKHGTIIPPAVYRQWWLEIARCAHRWGDFNRMRWQWGSSPKDSVMQMYHSYFICPSVLRVPYYCDGWWSGNTNHDTFVAIGHLLDERVIKHEMLHDLLGRENTFIGQPHHPLFAQCHVE